MITSRRIDAIMRRPAPMSMRWSSAEGAMEPAQVEQLSRARQHRSP
jgi:hypothetical protein